jgi:hypothetical protein
MSINVVIFDLFALSNLVAMYYGVKYFSSLGVLKLFLIMLLASAAQSFYVAITNVEDYIPLTVLTYSIIEFYVIVLYFITVIQNRLIRKYVFYIIFACFFYLFYLFYFDRSKLNHLNPYFLIFETLFLLILSMIHFVEIFENDKITNLTRCPEFLVTSAIVFYFSITCPSFLFASLIRDPNIPLRAEINFIAYLVFNISLSQSFKWKKQNT